MKWASGKKTYILAIAVTFALALLVAVGKLTPDLALDVLAFAAPCFAVTFRDAIQVNHNQVLAVLEDLAQVGADIRLHKPDMVAVDGETLAKLVGPMLVPNANPEAPKAGS